jgi:hypothetical protein
MEAPEALPQCRSKRLFFFGSRFTFALGDPPPFRRSQTFWVLAQDSLGAMLKEIIDINSNANDYLLIRSDIIDWGRHLAANFPVRERRIAAGGRRTA